MNKARTFLLTLLGSCAMAGVLVVVIGLTGGRLKKMTGPGSSGAPTLPEGHLAVSPPSFMDQRKSHRGDVCFDSYNIVWESGQDGHLYANGEPYIVRGISWFGCEGMGYTFTGLNHSSIDNTLNWVTEQKYNTLRIPFSAAFALEDHVIEPTYLNDELKGKTPFEILDVVFEKAALRGIQIVLDLHFTGPLVITELWYDDQYSEKDMIEAWHVMLKRYGEMWNLMGVDLKNEPNGKATWGDDSPETDVNKFYERAIRNMSISFPEYKGLYFVEGTQFMDAKSMSDNGAYPYWWGGNFEGARKHPIKAPRVDNRIVYSPHVYGPSVFLHPYMEGPNFRDEVVKVWDSQMGWLAGVLKKAIVIGEWGGSLVGKDKDVLEELAQWLTDECMLSNIWWAINPESADTSGVMAWDWKSFDARKTDLTAKMLPEPPMFHIIDSKLCYQRGVYPASCPFVNGTSSSPVAVPQKALLRRT